jgi:hypothetical protein
MKTNVFYILMTIIVMGMVIPAFAGSPEKKTGDNTKTDNLSPTPLPPSPWTLHILVTDPNDSCPAIQHCTLGFFIQPISPDCVALSTTPTWTQQFYPGTADYYQSIPDSIKCVQVSIFDLGGNCHYPFNSNTCCKCKGDSQPCSLRICP